MLYNEFKDRKLSALGLGCMRLPTVDGKDSDIDEAQTAELVRLALRHGINYFDTLGITVVPGALFMELVHEYPDLTVRLSLYHAVIGNGTPQKLEHRDLRLIPVSQIDDYEFCPADEDILAELKRREREKNHAV